MEFKILQISHLTGNVHTYPFSYQYISTAMIAIQSFRAIDFNNDHLGDYEYHIVVDPESVEAPDPAPPEKLSFWKRHKESILMITSGAIFGLLTLTLILLMI